ncbi:hypothetical protein FP2506_12214 [Fulvimarina pelagi HTCC2506]|uniref:Uncharacterized protein n=1 Tax=Fulvimarina pelagi HTCC2506 TaxID=314231 RepID=Q0G1Q3_9HYPH|nr:hypothetical protein FP2506_12214 [Fulvimarina pelagi HTCC2506]
MRCDLKKNDLIDHDLSQLFPSSSIRPF